MNKKVFISMLILTISFLVGLYILKIFYPQEFIMVIQNEQFIKIGNFIDSHKWCFYMCSTITAFVTYWFYICACCEKKYLKFGECIIVLVAIAISFLINEYSPNIAMYYSFCIMIILPAILKGKLLNTAIISTTHIFAQYLSLGIRSLPLLLTNINFAILLALGIESYLWLILFYMIFNYNKKER